MANSDRFLTKEMVIELGKKDKYYNENRWEHYDELLVYLKQMGNLGKVLEIGPYKTPLVQGCDVMDLHSRKYPFEINKFIKHDCTDLPFPIRDKEYDLVIASQVLEHLGVDGEQVEIFDELERISERALVSLPYKWYAPKFRTHHMIDRRVFDDWASHREYDIEEITGDNLKRILRIYIF